MNVNFTARHFTPPADVREYGLKKIEKIHKYFPRPISCRIVLSREGNGHTTDITLSVSKKSIYVTETSDDVYKSIDGAVEKLITRLVKFKNTHYLRK